MATAINSNLGAGSGLPLTETLAKLRTVEEAPLALLAQQYQRNKSKLDAYNTLRNTVASFQNAGNALAKPLLSSDKNLFGATTAKVTGGEGLTATTGNGAIAGQYSVTIQSLATRGVRSGALDSDLDRYAQLGTGGTVTFKLKGDTADTEPRTLELKDTSLEGIVRAINDDKNLGVRATIINDGTSRHLQLTAGDTGVDADIDSITITGNDDVKTQIFDKLTNTQAAANASIKINDIVVSSGSNTVEDAIQGITLNLTAADPSKAYTLDVADNTEATLEGIRAFVTSYNAILSQIGVYTDYTTKSENNTAPLNGDYLARSVQSRIRETLTPVLDSGDYRTLSGMGITTNFKTGQLEIDETKLTTALRERPGDVTAIFQGETGVAAKTKAVTEEMLRTDGLFYNGRTSLERTQENLEKQDEQVRARIEDTMARYTARFVALDVLVAQMSSTSSYLTSQISVLNGTRNS